MQTTLRKRVSFKEEAEELGADQEFGKWMIHVDDSDDLSGESNAADEDSAESEDEPHSLWLIIAVTKMTN